MILIDMHNAKPIYEQIKHSFRGQILRGLLQPNEKLPSVRELAQSTAINPNTIQKAYRDLEQEGYVYCVAGKGCFVAELSADTKNNYKQELLTAIKPLLSELSNLGVSEQEILNLMRKEK